jgi:uncharacterized protein YjbI with pentapeptide repeats
MARTAQKILIDHANRFDGGKRIVWHLMPEEERSNLRGTDLRGTDLSDANLRGANLSGASLPISYGIFVTWCLQTLAIMLSFWNTPDFIFFAW